MREEDNVPFDHPASSEGRSRRSHHSSRPSSTRLMSKPDLFNVNFLSSCDEIYLNSQMLTTTFHDYQRMKSLEGSGRVMENVKSVPWRSKSSDSFSTDDSERSSDEKSPEIRRSPFDFLSFPFNEQVSKSQMVRGNAAGVN
ncbi:hypothetical protein RUM44_006600 [Polyplax serrata]|uniref:Uncharacterized protein n=1 Tax=Polyplax serrata TaxID=468196 RepID=A0ABR1AIK0_POLSC